MVNARDVHPTRHCLRCAFGHTHTHTHTPITCHAITSSSHLGVRDSRNLYHSSKSNGCAARLISAFHAAHPSDAVDADVEEAAISPSPWGDTLLRCRDEEPPIVVSRKSISEQNRTEQCALRKLVHRFMGSRTTSISIHCQNQRCLDVFGVLWRACPCVWNRAVIAARRLKSTHSM